MAARIGGAQMCLWRAVDDEGEGLDVLARRRRDKAAAFKLTRKLTRKHGFAPSEIIADKLRSYGAAFAEFGLTAGHEQGLRKDNRAEVSRQPVRRREREMQRFKSPGSAQRFVSVHAAAYNAFNVQRHPISRRMPKTLRAEAMAQWHGSGRNPGSFPRRPACRDEAFVGLLVVGGRT